MQVERRFYPRYSVTCIVQLRIQLDNELMELTGHAVNLSQNGAQLTCDQQVIDTLLEQNSHPIVCQMYILLPGAKPVTIDKSRLVVNRRLAQDNYHLGFNFVDISAEVNQQLTTFLEKLKQQQVQEKQKQQEKKPSE
jgi:c-di-GMP-binding flagellar brake protein YcgR